MANVHLLSPKGFRAAGVYAGIKTKQRPDVGLLVCDTPATAAAAFTTNTVVSPAVTVGREHIAKGKLRGVVVNSGNANACTGRQGLADARRMCALAGELIGADATQFLPSSTGIIGHLLPMDKVERGIRAAADQLGNSEEHALQFGDAILTTDTRRKIAGVRVKIGRETISLSGVCKGSGMIGPRLGVGSARPLQGTMLAYLTTDARLNVPLMLNLMREATDATFNCVTVDDHASTNDTAVLLASGAGGAIESRAAIRKFGAALNEVCQSLAYQIAADGEGATKVVAITVSGASTIEDARLMARTIANSPLVKCAMNGNDPNWGRIVSAAGFAGAKFDPDKCTLNLQGTTVFKAGQPVRFDAAEVSSALAAEEVKVDLRCGLGKASATVWTCDLSKEYVTINADYHT